MDQPTPKAIIIKTIYFYLVCFVGLMMVVFSTADLINLALKTWVFTRADYNYYASPAAVCAVPAGKDTTNTAQMQADCEKQQADQIQQQKDSMTAQKQSDAVRDISMVAVGIPLFIFHWKIVRRKDF